MLYPINRFLRKSLSVVILLATICFPGIACAEVSDKTPSLQYIWIVAISSGLVCLAAAYIKRWLLFFVAVFPLVWFVSLFLEIHSPDVGPALLAEAGYSYFVQAYLAIFVVCVLGTVGWLLHKKRTTNK